MLLKHQKSDGSWYGRWGVCYIYGTWAVDTLIQCKEKNNESVKKGLTFLLKESKSAQSLTYPTGIGLPGQFYVNYHSYHYLFPLLTFAHYLKKK